MTGLRAECPNRKLYVPALVPGRVPNPYLPLLLDSVDPNGLNNPTAPWNIVNGAAGHYDGLDTLKSPTYYSVKAFDE